MKIAEVWYALGGPEIKSKRSVAFWRGGKDPNVSIDHERGLWYDFVSSEGGGIVALVMVVLGYDTKQAYRWLGATFGTPYIRHRKVETEKRERLWLQGLISDLERKKLRALLEYARTESDKDLMDWQWASRKLYLAQQIGHNNLCAEFEKERQSNQPHVDEMIGLAISSRKRATEVARRVVDILARE